MTRSVTSRHRAPGFNPSSYYEVSAIFTFSNVAGRTALSRLLSNSVRFLSRKRSVENQIKWSDNSSLGWEGVQGKLHLQHLSRVTFSFRTGIKSKTARNARAQLQHLSLAEQRSCYQRLYMLVWATIIFISVTLHLANHLTGFQFSPRGKQLHVTLQSTTVTTCTAQPAFWCRIHLWFRYVGGVCKESRWRHRVPRSATVTPARAPS